MVWASEQYDYPLWPFLNRSESIFSGHAPSNTRLGHDPPFCMLKIDTLTFDGLVRGSELCLLASVLRQ